MIAARFAALALSAMLTACSSPNPVLYTIAPAQGPVHAGGSRVIELAQVSMPRYLERSQIVRSSENYQLDVMSNDWWGEPLGAMLGRVLVDELSQRLPQSTVVSESGAVTVSPDATIELNMQRLDEDVSGNLVLQAQASVSFKGRPGQALRNFRFVVAPPEPGIRGEVNAISSAVGQLADGLASVLASG
jgi:uncharacterized lipoprotein YmbA